MKGRVHSGEKLEILAPAGAKESVYAAVRCGAEAVYVGGEKFSARANAVNFSAKELSEAIDYCHLHNVKIYQTLNTLIFDGELKELLKTARLSAEMGVDAFIVQDLGAAAMLKDALPDMKLTASTQLSVHTKEGALFAKEAGFSRVVVARELSLAQIEEICAADIEVEAFIHGALCMSVSGQCYMSALIGSRSANRGQCAQACRLPFSAIEGKERYDLSLKDLSLTEHIEALRKAGVASLKIEGRMKRAEYVAAAVSAVKAARDGTDFDTETLRAVFSRSGFTDGYITGRLGADMFGTRTKEDVISAKDVLPRLAELYRREIKAAAASFHARIKANEPALLEMTSEGITVSVTGDIPAKAENRPTDITALEKQLCKLGDTPYDFAGVTAEIDGGLNVPASQLNAMRREAVEKLNAARIKAKKREQRYNEPKHDILSHSTPNTPKLRVRFCEALQLEGAINEAELIILPVDEILKNAEKCAPFKARLCAALPRFTADERELIKKLGELQGMGIKDILCTNAAHIRIGKALGFTMRGGFGLNVTNSLTLRELEALGLADALVSFELKLSQINRLGGDIPFGIIAYGRLPAMLTRNCPIKQAVGSCKNCTGALTDRTKRNFPVSCDGISCEVLNSDILVMSDKLCDINADFIELDFYDETAEEIRRVSECYLSGRKLDIKNMTRGLYYRGVI